MEKAAPQRFVSLRNIGDKAKLKCRRSLVEPWSNTFGAPQILQEEKSVASISLSWE